MCDICTVIAYANILEIYIKFLLLNEQVILLLSQSNKEFLLINYILNSYVSLLGDNNNNNDSVFVEKKKKETENSNFNRE